nr:hypothetical protein BgiMline_015302 [Biomphalaria glabrata]
MITASKTKTQFNDMDSHFRPEKNASFKGDNFLHQHSASNRSRVFTTRLEHQITKNDKSEPVRQNQPFGYQRIIVLTGLRSDRGPPTQRDKTAKQRGRSERRHESERRRGRLKDRAPRIETETCSIASARQTRVMFNERSVMMALNGRCASFQRAGRIEPSGLDSETHLFWFTFTLQEELASQIPPSVTNADRASDTPLPVV